MQHRRTLGAHDLRRVAVLAYADPRTVQAVLRGDNSVKELTRTRVLSALEACGFAPAVAASSSETAERRRA